MVTTRVTHRPSRVAPISFPLAAAVLFASPAVVWAQEGVIKEDDLRVKLVDSVSLIPLLGRIIGFVLLLAGIVAFFYVLYGGFIYMTAGGDSGAVGKARTTIANALIGIILISFSYALVRFVIAQTQRNFSGNGATQVNTNNNE